MHKSFFLNFIYIFLVLFCDVSSAGFLYVYFLRGWRAVNKRFLNNPDRQLGRNRNQKIIVHWSAGNFLIACLGNVIAVLLLGYYSSANSLLLLKNPFSFQIIIICLFFKFDCQKKIIEKCCSDVKSLTFTY
jgi:hypothetical protein